MLTLLLNIQRSIDFCYLLLSLTKYLETTEGVSFKIKDFRVYF